MQETCHRCGGDLPVGSGESPFCPHCGTPQLTLALENQSVEAGGEPAVGADGQATTGAVAPPRPRQVDWKTAIRCAALVAAIGAALMLVAVARVDALSPVGLLWLLSASMITLALYQRKLPSAWMDARVGARIGVVVGVCLTLGLAMSMAGWGLVQRYALHGMGSFDAQMAAQVVQMQQQLTQRAAEQQTAITPAMKGFLNSPEFHAGILLTGYAMMSVMLLVVSVLGGAFGGLLRMRRKA